MRTAIKDLLPVHRDKNLEQAADSRLHFELLPENEGKDVYNISAPFYWQDRAWLLGRVEARDSEFSRIGFFGPIEAEAELPLTEIRHWHEKEVLDLHLQDPFYTVIGSEIVIGGVEVVEVEPGAGLSYRTVFYKGEQLENLKKFAAGPWGMKDIRLAQLPDGRILLLTRPQGDPGGRGTIGWLVMVSLDELTVQTIESATLLDDQFLEEEWGGGNEIHVLDQNRAGILAHIARFDDAGNRHYYASVFVLNYTDGSTTPMEIIAERRDFAPGSAKRPDLEDVIFSGGLIRLEDGEAVIYCGTADSEAHKRVIEDPFYEREKTDNHAGHRTGA